MGGQQSKSEEEIPDKVSNSDSESEIKIILEKVQHNVNKKIKQELEKAEDSIEQLFIRREKTKSKPEIVSINMSESDKPNPNLLYDSQLSATSPLSPKQKELMNKMNTNSDLKSVSDSDSSSKSKSNSDSRPKKPQMGGLTESEINVQVVPLSLKGGSNKFNANFSDSSPFITSEVFKKTLEQNGGANVESEFDSNKLLNIIMQMGGEDSNEDSDKNSDKKDDNTEDDEDDEDDDLFDSEDDDSEDAKKKVSRPNYNSKFERKSTPRDNSSSSSSNSSSSDSSSSSSSSSNDTSSSSSSNSTLVKSVGLAVPRRVAGLSGLNSSDSESSVYIMSSDSSIGSRDINLLSFDEPATWGKAKAKKSKKSKKAKKY